MMAGETDSCTGHLARRKGPIEAERPSPPDSARVTVRRDERWQAHGGARVNEPADIVVIGAGVQGASLAFHLARRGARVAIVERTAIGAGATGRSSGLVRMHYDLLADARIAHESLAWFRDWEERVGGDCGFTKTGFVQIVGTEKAEAGSGRKP